jgi:hypothetical protein
VGVPARKELFLRDESRMSPTRTVCGQIWAHACCTFIAGGQLESPVHGIPMHIVVLVLTWTRSSIQVTWLNIWYEEIKTLTE